MFGDRGDGRQRVVVGPGEVGVHGVTDPNRPVARRDPLVRAQCLGVRRLQMLEGDVSLVDVIPCRQAGFEQQHRAVGIGEQHPVQFDRDVAV